MLTNAHISRVTSKGQVLLHKSVRDELGIRPGEKVRVGSNEHGQAVIESIDNRQDDPDERVRRFEAAVARLAGKYATGRSTDEEMRMLRGDQERWRAGGGFRRDDIDP